MTSLNDLSGFSWELLPPFWISYHVTLADLSPGWPLGMAVLTGTWKGLLIGSRWGVGNDANTNLEYLILFLFFFFLSLSKSISATVPDPDRLRYSVLYV